MFLRVERKNAEDHRHKLASLTECPFKVTKADNKTVFIERTSLSVERGSRATVVLALRCPTIGDLKNVLQPTEMQMDFPVTSAINLDDIYEPPKKQPKQHETAELTAARTRSQDDTDNTHNAPTQERVIKSKLSTKENNN